MACSLRPFTLQNSNNNNNNVEIKGRAEGEMEQKKKKEILAKKKFIQRISRLRKKTNIAPNTKKKKTMPASESPIQSVASPASSTYIQSAFKTIKLKSEYIS